MTLLEALHNLDEHLPNTLEEAEKIQWLSRLDTMAAGVMQSYEQAEPFEGYTMESPRDTVLRIPAPYDECYGRYLEAELHYRQGEIDRYNNAIVLFNNAFSAFRRAVCREHIPLNRGRFQM